MIRDFLASDIPAIKNFFIATQVFHNNEIDCLEEDLSLFLEGQYQGDRIFVHASSQVDGLIHFGPLAITDRSWCLHWIGVDPHAPIKGIGSQLLAAMEDEIKQKNGRLILIETSSRDDYTKTRAFYLKHNYQLATQIKDYYADGDDKCIYLKKI
ncbi:MAG: GNAT family N-acetyltransferase [Oligoflexus sp.]